MFESVELQEPGVFGHRRLVRDLQRDVELFRIKRSRGGAEDFILRVGRDRITVRTQQFEAMQDGWHQFRAHIGGVGLRNVAANARYDYIFTDAEDRLAMLRLAAEAILVLGIDGEGLKFADGIWVTTFAVGDALHEFRLSDFGYAAGVIGQDVVRPRSGSSRPEWR